MTLFLSALCSLFAIGLVLELLLNAGSIYYQLPQFTATLSGILGIVIAGMEYKGRKGQKKRRAPLFFLFFAIFAAMIGTLVWLYFLLKARHVI